MTDQEFQQAADVLRQAYAPGQPCPPVRESLKDLSVENAYAIQQINTQYWLQQDRRLVGRKIGLTSTVVQRQLGVDQPDYGMLFADMCIPDDGEVPFDTLLQPKVEAEIALVLNRALESEQNTIADVISAVDYVLPAIEIVDSRIADWDITIVDTIADNASSGLFVLGGSPRKLDEVDLRLCGMVMERFGEQVSVGAGMACLGNPLNATVWLANVMAAAGRALQPGDIVLSGALGPMVSVSPGDIFETSISGVGTVRTRFSEGADS
ncbi:MAG: 2-keto-4-pentenoate hydratase [Pseudomonadales bacterium]